MILALWLFPAIVGGFLGGFVVGRNCEGNRWMDNADAVQRIEWKGSLFKVERRVTGKIRRRDYWW